MHKNINIYPLLVLGFLVHLFLTRFFSWIPDLTLIIVVFVGVFCRLHEAVLIGLIAGILQGSVSIGTIPIDMVAFPLVGAVSSLMARELDRQSPLSHMLITLTCIMLAISLQTIYMNIYFDNSVGIKNMILGNWWHIVLTSIVAPIMFSIFKEIVHIKE